MALAYAIPEATATQAPVSDISNLADKTVFLRVSFGLFGNSRKVDGDGILHTDADTALLKVTKALLESQELEAIRKADADMKKYLTSHCLPFDAGIRLVPVGMIGTVEAKLAEYAQERTKLVDAFIAVYPALCQTAATRLRELYKPSDYPNADEVRSRFVFDWQYVSFSVPGHLKSINPEIFEQQKQKSAEMFAEAQENIVLLARQTMLEMVSHLKERLTPAEDGKPKIFRNTAVENLREFLNTYNERFATITNDAELAELVNKGKALLSGCNVQALREVDSYRDSMRSEMSAIAAQLGTMVEAKGRKFRE